MRFWYLDPGLRNNVGHHANYCRYIVGELRARGIETIVFGCDSIDGELRSETGANPHFRAWTYIRSDPDPICGWLIDFDTFTRVTADDLGRLPAIQPSDVVYMNSVRPFQLMAVGLWLRNLPTDRQPTVVVEICESGLLASNGRAGLEFASPDPRQDERPTLFRFAARKLPSPGASRLHLICFDQSLSQALSRLLARPVRTLALPYRAVAMLRNRAGARPTVVAMLGHQRAAKGFRQLPEIVTRLLRSRPDVRLLIQQVGHTDAPETERALRELAATDDRLMLEERPAGKMLWAELLERSTLVLCPYLAQPYIATFSAVASEALANGIPLVVPAGTTLEKMLVEFGGPGVAFDDFEPASVVAATEHAVDHIDRYATLAHEAAVKWPERHGPARLVDGLESLVSSAPALARMEGGSQQ